MLSYHRIRKGYLLKCYAYRHKKGMINQEGA